jgi:hypothetical protein
VTTLLDLISFEGKALHKFSRGFRGRRKYLSTREFIRNKE